MSWLSRFVSVIRSDRLNRDLDDEIRFHLDARTEEHTRAGLSIEEASARARRQFGSPALVRDASRDIKLFPRLESILRDVSFATAAVATQQARHRRGAGVPLARRRRVYRGVLPDRRPHPPDAAGRRSAVADLRRLASSCGAPRWPQLQLPAVSRDARRQQPAGPAVCLERPAEAGRGFRRQRACREGLWPVGLRRCLRDPRSEAGARQGADLDGRYQSRSAPGRGPELRLLDASICQEPGCSWSLGHDSGEAASDSGSGGEGLHRRRAGRHDRRLGSDDDVGRSRDLRTPTLAGSGSGGGCRPASRRSRRGLFCRRSSAGSSASRWPRRPAESPERHNQLLNTRVHLRSAATGRSGLREDFARALWVLGAIAALVLLVACTNVASLLVARATARQREMALRASIGAGRGRLIQQALIESGLLALTSCALGAVLSVVATPKIVSMISTSGTTVRLDVWPDWRVLVFLGGLGILVTFLFGLAPALHASSRSDSRRAEIGRRRHATQVGLFRPLVAAQIAFSFVVLFVGGLCLTSFVKLLRTDLGFDASNVALVSVTASSTARTSEPAPASWASLLERLEHTPGIDVGEPFALGVVHGLRAQQERADPGSTGRRLYPWYLEVSPGFLRTMRIPLVAGRDLEWRDAQCRDCRLAVIVNESFARRYFPGESAIGKRFFRIDGGATLVAQEVIGVAKDAKYTDLREPAPPTVYEPYWPQNAAVVQVRTRLEMGALLAAAPRRSSPRACRVSPRRRHAAVHARGQPSRARPRTGAAVGVLLPGGGRPGDCRSLRAPQLHRASADTGNWHSPRPRRATGADCGPGPAGGRRNDADRSRHWRSRRCLHRPIHDSAVVRGHAVGHVEYHRASALLCWQRARSLR